jgi:hypothetical protein
MPPEWILLELALGKDRVVHLEGAFSEGYPFDIAAAARQTALARLFLQMELIRPAMTASCGEHSPTILALLAGAVRGAAGAVTASRAVIHSDLAYRAWVAFAMSLTTPAIFVNLVRTAGEVHRAGGTNMATAAVSAISAPLTALNVAFPITESTVTSKAVEAFAASFSAGIAGWTHLSRSAAAVTIGTFDTFTMLSAIQADVALLGANILDRTTAITESSLSGSGCVLYGHWCLSSYC